MDYIQGEAFAEYIRKHHPHCDESNCAVVNQYANPWIPVPPGDGVDHASTGTSPEPIPAAPLVGFWEGGTTTTWGSPTVPPEPIVPAITSATVIAALESDREALRRVAEGLAVRVAKLEAQVAELEAAQAPKAPADPLAMAKAAHPWLQEPMSNWKVGR